MAEIVQINEYGEVKKEVIPGEFPTAEPVLIQNTSSTESAEEAWQSSQVKVTTAFFRNATEYPVAFFRRNQLLLTTLGWILLALLGTRILFATLDVIDDIPLVTPNLKLIGLGTVAWFVWRYLIRANNRQELAQMLDGAKAELLGSRAEAILNHRGSEEGGVYDIPKAESTSVERAVAVAADPLPTPPVLTTDAEAVKLYEERLVVDKERVKTGEVALGKHVEVETARASVLIEKERVVIERTPMGDTTAITPGTDAFSADEAIKMEVYEEIPDIHKEAFVREEVNLRKEAIQEIVNAEETLRREELSIGMQGHPVVEKLCDSVVDDHH